MRHSFASGRTLAMALLAVLAVASAAPPPALFDLSWDARDDLLADLVPAAIDAAAELTQADIYHLHIEIDASLSRIHVEQEVLVFNRGDAPLTTVPFHLYPNLLGATLDLQGLWFDGAAIEPDYLPPGRRALLVAATPPLAPGDKAVVRLAFELEIPTAGGRNYGILSLGEGILSLAHAYALRAIPADSDGEILLPSEQGDLVFAETSFYRVRVVAPAELTVVTTGREHARSVTAGVQTLTFVAGPVRDFYLSASYDFESTEHRLDDTLVRSFSLRGDGGAARLALAAAAEALSLFGSRFSPYPYREFDLVPIDFGAFGIEFPGIVGLSTTLYRPGAPPGFLEGTTVHEVAHQWFYGLVGNDQGNEPWLDESFSQFATLQYFGERYGAEGYNGFRSSLEARWRRVSGLDLPVGRPVAAYPGVAYGAIIYGLGPLVLERLEAEIGSDTFAALLRDYVREYRWKIADGDDFRRAAEQACACDLAPFFARWIDQ